MIKIGLFNQIVNPPKITTKIAVINGIFAIFLVCNQPINNATNIAGTKTFVANMILKRLASSKSSIKFSGIGAL